MKYAEKELHKRAENRYMEIESAPHNVVIDLCRVKNIQKEGKSVYFTKSMENRCAMSL